MQVDIKCIYAVVNPAEFSETWSLVSMLSVNFKDHIPFCTHWSSKEFVLCMPLLSRCDGWTCRRGSSCFGREALLSLSLLVLKCVVRTVLFQKAFGNN